MDKGLIVHALIFNEKREILLIRRSANEDILPGVWDIPGGTLEDGEDPGVGAVREIKEETGLDVRNLNLFHYTSNVDQKKNKQFVRLIFIGACGKADVVLNSEDHDLYRWISVGASHADMNMVEYIPALLGILKEKRHQLLNYQR